MVNYYQVLEVPFWASFEDIKRAYRSRLKLVHPDINNNSGKEISILREAYENLSNRDKRNSYDDKVRRLFEDTLKIRTSKKVVQKTIKISIEEALSGCMRVIGNQELQIPALSKEISGYIIEVTSNEGVSLEDRGLVIDLLITAAQAQKGCAARVPYIEKPVICRVPAGVRNGDELEVRSYTQSAGNKKIKVFLKILCS